MYSSSLTIVETSFSGVFGFGARQTSNVESVVIRRSPLIQPAKSTTSVSCELRAERLHSSTTSPSPTKIARQSDRRRAELGEGSQRVVDAVLRAHQPDEADQEGHAVLQREVRVAETKRHRIRCVADDEDIVGRLLAAAERDLLVGVVRDHDDVGQAVGEPLGHQRAADRSCAVAEVRAKLLGDEVVLIEDEGGAVSPGRAGGEQEHVRRVAGLDHVDAALGREPADEPPHLVEGRAVLAGVADDPSLRRMRRVAMDPDAVAHLVGLGIACRPLRADDHHLDALGRERQRLLPDPPVGRDGQVLDEDERAPHDVHPPGRRSPRRAERGPANPRAPSGNAHRRWRGLRSTAER